MYRCSLVTNTVLPDGPIQHIHIQLGCWQNLGVDIHPSLYQFPHYTIYFSQVQRTFVKNYTLSILVTVDADCSKGFIYDWNAKKKDLGDFFLIQMSSCMLCISKHDLPLTAPVFNPFETFFFPFLLLLVSKATIFLFHLINHNMVGFISAAWKSKIFEDIIWFDI